MFAEHAREVINDDDKGLLLFNQVDEFIEEFVVNVSVLLCTKHLICSNVASLMSHLCVCSALMSAKKRVELTYFLKENINDLFSFNM